MVGEYYNSHLYLFTNEFKSLHPNKKVLAQLIPYGDRMKGLTRQIYRHNFSTFLENLEIGAAMKIHNRVFCTLEESLELIDKHIETLIEQLHVSAPMENVPDCSDELIIYNSLLSKYNFLSIEKS